MKINQQKLLVGGGEGVESIEIVVSSMDFKEEKIALQYTPGVDSSGNSKLVDPFLSVVSLFFLLLLLFSFCNRKT